MNDNLNYTLTNTSSSANEDSGLGEAEKLFDKIFDEENSIGIGSEVVSIK